MKDLEWSDIYGEDEIVAEMMIAVVIQNEQNLQTIILTTNHFKTN